MTNLHLYEPRWVPRPMNGAQLKAPITGAHFERVDDLVRIEVRVATLAAVFRANRCSAKPRKLTRHKLHELRMKRCPELHFGVFVGGPFKGPNSLRDRLRTGKVNRPRWSSIMAIVRVWEQARGKQNMRLR